MNETTGFIGGGRVVRILLYGWSEAGMFPPTVMVSDPDRGVRTQIAEEFPGIHVVHDNARAAKQDLVFLAVHPPDAGKVLGSINSVLKDNAIVVSLMPKLTIAQISQMLGGFDRIARVIPNAPE